MSPAEARGQFAAVAQVRWRIFLNSLRTTSGKLELISRAIVTVMLLFLGLGGAVGMGIGAWYFISRGRGQWLVLLLWPVFFFWQFLPIMASAFTPNTDAGELLRFPLNYRSYFLIRLAYGSLDPATVTASLWLLGMTVGVGIARAALLPWTALVLLVFALFNLLHSRMIFAWIDRWLAKRRTREIFGVLFFLVIMSFQFVGPLARSAANSRPTVGLLHSLSSVQQMLPPGVAGGAIAGASRSQWLTGLGAFALLCAYAAAALWLLSLRLRAQYYGENLSEAAAPTRAPASGLRPQPGWRVFGLPGPIAATFEKELRYLGRSGPMLFTMIMPLFILLLFRFGPSSMDKGGGPLVRHSDLAFPVVAAYTLLLLTNIVYNSFGAEGGGMQLFFAAPARFRQILLGKNLAHAAILGLQMMIVWVGVWLLYRPPGLEITVLTLAGVFFALPLDFIIGNLLSVYSPKKIDYGTLGKQRASKVTMLVSFAARIVIFGLAALLIVLARLYGNLWLAAPMFLALAVAGFAAYATVLTRVERMALERREVLITELGKV
jgi:ABC-2 type transport system permease protein